MGWQQWLAAERTRRQVQLLLVGCRGDPARLPVCCNTYKVVATAHLYVSGRVTVPGALLLACNWAGFRSAASGQELAVTAGQPARHDAGVINDEDEVYKAN